MFEWWTAAGMAVVVAGAGALATTMSDKCDAAGETDRAPTSGTGDTESSPTEPTSTWHAGMEHCEHAVNRATRSVDTITDERVRQRLRAVIRRMDAEIPNVRALVELGRGLEATSYSDQQALQRVRDQLEVATTRFETVADHIVQTVVDWVSSQDAAGLDTAVAALRGRFPLLLPLSSLSVRRSDSETLVRS